MANDSTPPSVPHYNARLMPTLLHLFLTKFASWNKRKKPKKRTFEIKSQWQNRVKCGAHVKRNPIRIRKRNRLGFLTSTTKWDFFFLFCSFLLYFRHIEADSYFDLEYIDKRSSGFQIIKWEKNEGYATAVSGSNQRWNLYISLVSFVLLLLHIFVLAFLIFGCVFLSLSLSLLSPYGMIWKRERSTLFLFSYSTAGAMSDRGETARNLTGEI